MENTYIEDFKIYTNGNPPGSLEPSIIIHDLIIIEVLSQMTNKQKGITKTKYPTISIMSFCSKDFSEYYFKHKDGKVIMRAGGITLLGLGYVF